MKTFLKDPDAKLDFVFDWSAWLTSGEVINNITVTADTGITVDSSTITDAGTSVTVWLSGGTVETDYSVTCHVTTDASREDDRTIMIMIRER